MYRKKKVAVKRSRREGKKKFPIEKADGKIGLNHVAFVIKKSLEEGVAEACLMYLLGGPKGVERGPGGKQSSRRIKNIERGFATPGGRASRRDSGKRSRKFGVRKRLGAGVRKSIDGQFCRHMKKEKRDMGEKGTRRGSVLLRKKESSISSEKKREKRRPGAQRKEKIHLLAQMFRHDRYRKKKKNSV